MAARDLDELLRSMRPVLRPDAYVFTVGPQLPACPVMVSVTEDGGLTAVVTQSDADQLELEYEYVAAMITLQVNSDLAAVGLTAAVATALANEQISCNVVAGYFHDHLFVSWDDRDRALITLGRLSAGQ